jgi:hypothetical protein
MSSFFINPFYHKTSFVSLHITIWITIGLKYGIIIFICGNNLPLRIRTFHGLTKVDRISITHSDVNLISWRNTIYSYYITLLFSLVDLLNGVCFWDVRVCSFGTIETISFVGISTLSWTNSRKGSWAMTMTPVEISGYSSSISKSLTPLQTQHPQKIRHFLIWKPTCLWDHKIDTP